ncbi:MAG TPA: hypothetical protein VI583_14610 [Cyclobacteriaceae bacterium]|nr:hypothetical protein [Cyclobacteriaceae bacterium]
MKTLFASGLLSIFLLYQAGYYVFYLSLERRQGDYWKDKVEQNHLEGDILIGRSIPISFPYQPDQEEFQPVLETFESEGKVYRVLKQRYARDTLHILYIDDHQGKQMKNSLRHWLISISHSPSAGDNQIVWDGLEKSFIPNHFEFAAIHLYKFLILYRHAIDHAILTPLIGILTPPPEADIRRH